MAWYYTEPRPQRRPLDTPVVRGTTNGGTGGPPTGPAGGDLTGTYPNPTIAAGAVGDAEITSVSYAKVTGAPTIPTTLPPSGPAGGDLAGTYPNPDIKALAVGTPELADGAVTDAKVTSVAYGKVTGAPTSLPPSGTATGDLTGSYPGPTIAAGAVTTTKLGDAPSGVTTAKLNDGAVTNVKIADVAWTKVTGAPTSFPPSGSASGDLSGTYPGPTVAKVNGAALGTTTPLARGDLLVANATPALVRLARGTVSQVLQSDGTDVVWGPAPATGGPPTGTAGGDLGGTYPNPVVDGINGAAVGTTTPLARGDLLVANATPALARLAKGTTGQVLSATATDAVWQALTQSQLPTAPSGLLTANLNDVQVTTAKLAKGATFYTTNSFQDGTAITAGNNVWTFIGECSLTCDVGRPVLIVLRVYVDDVRQTTNGAGQAFRIQTRTGGTSQTLDGTAFLDEEVLATSTNQQWFTTTAWYVVERLATPSASPFLFKVFLLNPSTALDQVRRRLIDIQLWQCA